MVWADVTWHERFGGLGGFVRLLTIPLLMMQFRRSDGGTRVLVVSMRLRWSSDRVAPL